MLSIVYIFVVMEVFERDCHNLEKLRFQCTSSDTYS